jgi:RES domain-containing protein
VPTGARAATPLAGKRRSPERRYRSMPAIYAAATKSLAVLEILVHYAVLPRDFMMTEVLIPESTDRFEGVTAEVEKVPIHVLPPSWWLEAQRPSTQHIGKRFIEVLNAAVLAVPSCVIRGETNYVLNPAHRGFALIKFCAPEPFHFDARLK